MAELMSKLVPFSLAIVAANKAPSSKIIEATPHEHLSMLDGELTDNGVDYKATGSDSDGKKYQASEASSNTVKATWLPLGGGNRVTPPDVRRGELVMLYQFGDADKYYWLTLKDDLSLRKLETVIYAFSGTTNESDGVGPDTHYFLEISTHKKLVHFHTSKANGEPFAYDLQFNCAEGYIVLQDDASNVFTIDSKNKRIEISNTDNTHVDLDRQNYTVTVPGNSTINTSGNTVIKSGGNTTIESGGATSINSSGPTTLKAPKINFQGPFSVDGGSGGGSGADMIVMGNLKVQHLETIEEIVTPGITGLAAGIK